MTTTLTRLRGVRQPYFRPLAARAARVTGVLATALVAGQYVTLLFGLTGLVSLVVGGSVTIGIGILAHVAVNGRQRWAIVLTALLWAGWLIAGFSRHGWHNVATLGQALGWGFLTAVVVLALAEIRR